MMMDESPAMSGEDLQQYVASLRKQLQELTPAVLQQFELNEGEEEQALFPLPESVKAKEHTKWGIKAEKKAAMGRKLEALSEAANCKQHFDELGSSRVVVVGLGKVGSRIGQCLAKSGVGALALFDKGVVKNCHLEGSAYLQEHVGLNKTQAMRLAIFQVNSSIEVTGEPIDLLEPLQADVLRSCLDDGASVVVSCLDCPESRLVVNSICLEKNIVHFCAQVDDDCHRATVNLIVPGKTACLECLGAKTAAINNVTSSEQIFDRYTERDKAFFPGLSMVVAGLAAQNVMKHLLRFGKTLASFKYTFGGDDLIASRQEDTAAAAAPTMKMSFSKEYSSFQNECYIRCPNAICKMRLKKRLENEQK